MIAFAFATVLAMGKPTSEEKKIDPYQVLVVPRTPESNAVKLVIEEPNNGEVGIQNPVTVKFRVDGFAVGSGTPGERSKEIAVSQKGQTVHLIVDNEPYIPVSPSTIDPFNEEGDFFDTTFQLELPYHLKNGDHILRLFPVRSFGESLKGQNTFQKITFSIGDEKGSPIQDLEAPFLTYNQPSDQLPLKEGQPILLDFYLSNCELSPDSYTVLLTIDEMFERKLTSWEPYYIYGMKTGTHTIHLELLGPDGSPVKGPFNDVKRVIHVQ